MTTPVVNSENPMIERKKMRSLESSTPFWNPSKCGMTLNDVTKSTSHGEAQRISKLVTGGHPARIRNKQITTERMKLMT